MSNNIPIVKGPVIEDAQNWLEESYYDKYEILKNGDAILTKRSRNKYTHRHIKHSNQCISPQSSHSSADDPQI